MQIKSFGFSLHCARLALLLHQIRPTMIQNHNTQEQFKQVMHNCRELFEKKLHDYGAAWRVMRPSTMTDQLYIKAARIRSLQTQKEALVDEGIEAEFVAIVNYSIVAIIQTLKGAATAEDVTPEEALALYDEQAESALQLMLRKNHDYGEAWRAMRVSSFADLILMKIFRTKQIEELEGNTLVSEGPVANYQDMLNYAVFALIKLTLEA